MLKYQIQQLKGKNYIPGRVKQVHRTGKSVKAKSEEHLEAE